MSSYVRSTGRQRGYSLIEVVGVVLLLGVIAVLMAPGLRLALTMNDKKYAEEQTAINRKIANALLAYADTTAADPGLGVPAKSLPTPYADAPTRVVTGIASPTATTGLSAMLRDYGVGGPSFNDDATGVRRIRVYQKVSGIQQTAVPLQGLGGALVDLTIDYGIVYLTDCHRANSCATASPTRDSSLVSHVGLTRINYTTWAPLPSDIGLATVSTLPLQKQLLQQFSVNLKVLRETLKGFSKTFNRVCPNVNYLGSNVDLSGRLDARNRAPLPDCLSASADDLYDFGGGVTGQQANMGCWDGWYTLDPAQAPSGKSAGGMLACAAVWLA